jgi:hypothetical protein
VILKQFPSVKVLLILLFISIIPQRNVNCLRIPKLIMEWIPEERKKKGCPRKMWMEGVQVTMTRRNLEPDQWRNGGMVFGFRKTATAVI